MTVFESQVLGWVLSTLVGSGVAWWALRGRLTTIFQTREEAKERKEAHDQDIARIETKIEGARAVADRTANRIEVLSTQMQGEKDRLSDVSERLRRVDSKVDAIATSQAATTEALKGLGHSLDQLRNELRGRA